MPEQDQDNQFHVYVIVWMTPNESNPSERQISSISLHSNPEQARDYLKERIELLTDIPARSEAPSNGWENPIRAQKILLATDGIINGSSSAIRIFIASSTFLQINFQPKLILKQRFLFMNLANISVVLFLVIVQQWHILTQ